MECDEQEPLCSVCGDHGGAQAFVQCDNVDQYGYASLARCIICLSNLLLHCGYDAHTKCSALCCSSPPASSLGVLPTVGLAWSVRSTSKST